MDYFILFSLVLISSYHAVFGRTADGEVRVVVPKNVASNSTPTLYCQFNYDTKLISSVKWYRGSREIFRVTPNETPSIMAFNFRKLHVNIAASNISQMTLENVSPALSGQYVCQVTVSPGQTIASGKEMLYIYDPVYLEKPTIKTEVIILDEDTNSTNILCGFDVYRDINGQVERIPFAFYVNQQKIDPTLTVYEDSTGFLILNTSLMGWKDRSAKRISCSANLPGTSGLRSDELLLNSSKRLTADGIQSCCIIVIMFVLMKWCS